MKKQFYLLLTVLGLFLPFIQAVQAQAVSATTSIAWPYSGGTASQSATFTTGHESYFSLNYTTAGSGLTNPATKTQNDTIFTAYTPAVKVSGADANNSINFSIKPTNGLTFMPTSLTFNCSRFGTGGGMIDVKWLDKDGNATDITSGTSLKPARDQGSTYTVDLSAISATGDLFSIAVYIHSLDPGKQVGLANVQLSGTIAGTIVTVPTYTLTTSASPAEAGTVVTNPLGTVFDENTVVTLTATENFGYEFSHWENASQVSVSTDNPYSATIANNTVLTAVYNTLNTYSLTINVEGGANEYMVSASPEGTDIDGTTYYVEGTTVTLTAAENSILTFTNWTSGQTNSVLSFSMTENKTVTANYSAIDYIVGWDFYIRGSSSRIADFHSTDDNISTTLTLQDATGTIKSWLDKSVLAAGDYNGEPAAVNWNPIADKYYYQTTFNATDFTNIKVAALMSFNYNAYSVQTCEYSLNGTDWTALGTYTMTAAKTWYNASFSLPAAANNQSTVSIRWIPDYTSDLVGTTTTNDGTAISAIYVTGTAAIFNDGTAPVLSSSVPTASATGASATGKIVFTFDEKVQITSGTTLSLNGKELTPTVSGKTITFSYTGLEYGTVYNVSLAANTVSDLAGNTKTDAINLSFTTMTRPTVTKKDFDFVIGVDGDFAAALDAANDASSTGSRFYIFIPDGEYNIGGLTGDANQMTTITSPNVSFIGQSSDGVILYNKSINESINSTATIYFTSASDNIYMQDISLMNKMDYRTGTLLGRGVALWDQGDRNIYKNVKLLSNQDTYYTGSERSYLETCEVHGTVDFICGGGDIFFNECLIYLEERSGNVITAPATNSDWGYVFSNCTIDGFSINNGGYRLGRPWSNEPKSAFINTTMKVLPTAEAWGDPMNVVPSVFAEYNSLTSSGTSVDLSNRRSSYTKDAVSVTLNPVLTQEEAATYTVENVLSGSDTWQPKLQTEQATAPVISKNETTISWADSEYVLCWAIFKNNTFVEFVTTNSYAFPTEAAASDEFTVRAANEMGGLSAVSNSVTTSTETLKLSTEIKSQQYFSVDGKPLPSIDNANGLIIIRTIYSDGHVSTSKIVK